MAFQDQTLSCRDCGKPFVWTAGEQEFYAKKGFDNAPIRCPDCRRKKKAQGQGKRGGFEGERKMYPITCSKCGNQDEVPFQPRNDREVLCKNCFQEQRGKTE